MNARRRRLSEPRLVVAAATLATASAITGYLIAGATLGLYVAGIGFAALVAAPLAAAASCRITRVAIVPATALPIAIAWTIAGPAGSLLAAIVLMCWAGAIAGLTAIVRIPAIAIVLAALWLCWPVWLAPQLSGQRHARLVQTLVNLHPVFAINGAAPQAGVWTQQPIMYRVSPLGQDLPYQLPASVLPCAVAHALIAAALLIPVTRPTSLARSSAACSAGCSGESREE